MAARTSSPAPTMDARMASLEANISLLVASVDALVGALTSAPAASAPARGKTKTTARKARAHTFATKAEREAGGGFACACGRTGLRTAPHAGSFHKAPDGSTHTVE